MKSLGGFVLQTGKIKSIFYPLVINWKRAGLRISFLRSGIDSKLKKQSSQIAPGHGRYSAVNCSSGAIRRAPRIICVNVNARNQQIFGRFSENHALFLTLYV